MSATLVRAFIFLILWLAVAGREPSDLPVGAAVAAVAAWISVRLSPRSGARLRVRAAMVFLLEFLQVSFRSGLEVARRALTSPPDLRPGIVEARLRLAPGGARDAFCSIASLLPGTLLTGFDPTDEHVVYIHGLDVGQPIAAELADEESSFMRMIGLD